MIYSQWFSPWFFMELLHKELYLYAHIYTIYSIPLKMDVLDLSKIVLAMLMVVQSMVWRGMGSSVVAALTKTQNLIHHKKKQLLEIFAIVCLSPPPPPPSPPYHQIKMQHKSMNHLLTALKTYYYYYYNHHHHHHYHRFDSGGQIFWNSVFINCRCLLMFSVICRRRSSLFCHKNESEKHQNPNAHE